MNRSCPPGLVFAAAPLVPSPAELRMSNAAKIRSRFAGSSEATLWRFKRTAFETEFPAELKSVTISPAIDRRAPREDSSVAVGGELLS
jgi:hypothetical protein